MDFERDEYHELKNTEFQKKNKCIQLLPTKRKL